MPTIAQQQEHCSVSQAAQQSTNQSLPEVVDHLLARRQLLLSRLVKLDHALAADHQDLAEILRCRLCDDLVDYCSTGHFQAFHFSAVRNGDAAVASIAALNVTTSACIGFNDRFGESGAIDQQTLRGELADLLELLETRFEIEDDLLELAPATSYA